LDACEHAGHRKQELHALAPGVCGVNAIANAMSCVTALEKRIKISQHC
jgi:Ni,Fe-hydrogenase III large subunit